MKILGLELPSIWKRSKLSDLETLEKFEKQAMDELREALERRNRLTALGIRQSAHSLETLQKFKEFINVFQKLIVLKEWPILPTLQIHEPNVFEMLMHTHNEPIPQAMVMPRTGQIYVNTHYIYEVLNDHERALPLAHELGHLYHQDHNRYIPNFVKEMEADIFAHHLLNEAGYDVNQAVNVHTRIMEKFGHLINDDGKYYPKNQDRTVIYLTGKHP